MKSAFPCLNLLQCELHFNFCLLCHLISNHTNKNTFSTHSRSFFFLYVSSFNFFLFWHRVKHEPNIDSLLEQNEKFHLIYEMLIKLNYLLIFFFSQNLRHLKALSIADMNEIPTDLLESFDQLKVLNVSGNHFLNTSLTLLDWVSNLEVSASVKLFQIHFTNTTNFQSFNSQMSWWVFRENLNYIQLLSAMLWLCTAFNEMRKLHFTSLRAHEIKLAALILKKIFFYLIFLKSNKLNYIRKYYLNGYLFFPFHFVLTFNSIIEFLVFQRDVVRTFINFRQCFTAKF